VIAVRQLLVAIVLGLVVLVGAPAAGAADYPPGSPGVGVPNRSATGSTSALPRTGGDLTRELSLGAALLVAGGTILFVTRRRRGSHG
jgi:LPXTG-motif cell wall-anchored protein